jgi:hypothetical protein
MEHLQLGATDQQLPGFIRSFGFAGTVEYCNGGVLERWFGGGRSPPFAVLQYSDIPVIPNLVRT